MLKVVRRPETGQAERPPRCLGTLPGSRRSSTTQPLAAEELIQMPTVNEIYDEADKLKQAGKFDEAIAKYEQILTQDEKYALAHAALGVVLGKVGRHEEAVKHAQRVCELEPNDPFSFTALSVIFQRAFAGTGNRQFIQLAEEAMARARMLQG